MNKKGQEEPTKWLVQIAKGLAELFLVLLIVGGGIYGIIRASNLSPQDQDFKRVIDATEKLVNVFDDGKIHANAEYKVPIVSEDVLQIAFYTKGSVAMPPRCKGRTCLCMYYVVSDNKKETCKVIETKEKCSETCGETLCPGEPAQFTAKKGDTVRVAVECTDAGSKLKISKA